MGFPLRHVLLGVLFGLGCGMPAMAAETPRWPNHGRAERAFDVGFVMFVEHRDGQWHAWLPSYWGNWTPLPPGEAGDQGLERGQVMDFFTGEVLDVLMGRDELGMAIPEFRTDGGELHSPAQLGESTWMESMAFIHDWRIRDLSFINDWRLDPSEYAGCNSNFTVVDKLDEHGIPYWSRLVLDYAPPSERCPHGRWFSQARAILDLHDGTFLLAMSEKIVRLSFADLSPIGTGATVHIVDTDTVLDMIDTGGDIHELLNKALSDH